MKATSSNIKYCSVCDDFHELSEFGVDRRRSDGLAVYCKQVYRDRQKQYRQQQRRLRDDHNRTPGTMLPLQRVDYNVEGD